jgi:hypothetical protein
LSGESILRSNSAPAKPAEFISHVLKSPADVKLEAARPADGPKVLSVSRDIMI